MAQVEIFLDKEEMRALFSEAHQFLATVKKVGPAALLQRAKTTIRRRIKSTKRSPAGQAWKEWSPKYAATRGPSHSLLWDTGALYNAFEIESDKDSAILYNKQEYAAAQNYGNPSSNLPAREFFGLSFSDFAEIDKAVTQMARRARFHKGAWGSGLSPVSF